MNKQSKWAEIRDDYIEDTDEGFHVLHIDAWRTDGDNEEGVVIAKLVGINKDNKPNIYLSYQDAEARIDPFAQEVIQEANQKLRAHLEEQLTSNK